MSEERRPLEGVPMTRPPDPEALEREREWLRSLERAPAPRRWAAFLRQGGPGYLQSALTLGGGSASTALFAGAVFGYELLWVAPVAMLFGVWMLSAVAHQTLSTGLRPFEAMRRFAGPFFAWGWALGALISSFIWHFAQYSLASAMLQDIADATLGLRVDRLPLGLGVLVWAVATAWMYGSSPRLLRLFERLLQGMVYAIILCFGWVVLKTGVRDPTGLLAGFVPFRFPEPRNGVDPMTLVIGGLAAAVGANMLFLYPYSLLARGWGREHRRLARFDLIAGMFLPYCIAMSLMVIATANTLYVEGGVTGQLGVLDASRSLAAAVGPTAGRIVFGLGVLGMAASSITLQMLCSGFACSEMFGWKVGSLRYRLACLIPVPGVLGSVFWDEIAIWMAVPTTVLCGFLLPVAYLGFLRLQRSSAYLGADRPRGALGALWFAGMAVATGTLILFLAWFAWYRLPGWFEHLA